MKENEREKSTKMRRLLTFESIMAETYLHYCKPCTGNKQNITSESLIKYRNHHKYIYKPYNMQFDMYSIMLCVFMVKCLYARNHIK